MVPDLWTSNKVIIDDGKFEVQQDHLSESKSFKANFDELVKEHKDQIETMKGED